jgi:hypothetical protein
MAKKGKTELKQVASKHVTKRRVARWQKEKRRQRIIFFSGVAVILVVVAIIIGGVVASKSNDWLSKVKTDSGTITIKKTDYANELKLFRVYNSSVSTNESPLLNIENDYLIKDKAKTVGLNTSETEIDHRMLVSFGMENKSISDTVFQTEYKSMLSSYNLSDQQFRDSIEFSLLSEKLFGYYVNQTPESGPQSNVSMFTISNISIASELAQSWRNGESLNNLSKEYGIQSQSSSIVKGTVMNEAFDNVAFTIDIGNVSDPIPSDTGYYVIKVLERTDGPVSDAQRQSIGLTSYNDWFTKARKDNVERNSKLNLNEVYAWAVK